jgi:hypothetical protein
MRLLPYRPFSVETPLAPLAVAARLREAIEPNRVFSMSAPRRPLVGTIDGTSFDVMRNVTGRNSFRPRIRGTIEPHGSGASLTGTMQLAGIVIAFVGVYVFGAGAVFLWAAARSVENRQLEPALLPALGVLLFLLSLTFGAFAVEARRSLRVLIALVEKR